MKIEMIIQIFFIITLEPLYKTAHCETVSDIKWLEDGPQSMVFKQQELHKQRHHTQWQVITYTDFCTNHCSCCKL